MRATRCADCPNADLESMVKAGIMFIGYREEEGCDEGVYGL